MSRSVIPLTRRPTFLTLESADVAHSFWVPRVAGKTDLIPNRTNRMWVEPREPGTYLGQCAEYCGTQHTLMLLRVVAEPPEQFARWVEQQRQAAAAAPADPVAAAGRRVFLGTVCASCHAVAGTIANGRYGPDLTHLMSRATIGAGVAPNTRERLRAWVRNPDDLKRGVLMPADADRRQVCRSARRLSPHAALIETPMTTTSFPIAAPPRRARPPSSIGSASGS